MRTGTPVDRTLARIAVDGGGCWNFTGATRNGYGVVGLGSRSQGIGYTHRIVYEHLVGAIPEGLHIDHLCRNRLCCNPAHLEAVTQAENNRRAWLARPRTHCRRGHEFTPGNTRVNARQRVCRACVRLRTSRKKTAA